MASWQVRLTLNSLLVSGDFLLLSLEELCNQAIVLKPLGLSFQVKVSELKDLFHWGFGEQIWVDIWDSSCKFPLP